MISFSFTSEEKHDFMKGQSLDDSLVQSRLGKCHLHCGQDSIAACCPGGGEFCTLLCCYFCECHNSVMQRQAGWLDIVFLCVRVDTAT